MRRLNLSWWDLVKGLAAGALIALALEGASGLGLQALKAQDPVVEAPARPDLEQLLRAWEQYFLENFAPPAELILELGPLPEDTLGQTSIEGSEGSWVLRVTIREDLDRMMMVSVLLHELAHVQAFHPEIGSWIGWPHDAEWGMWYSRIWMRLVEGL